MVVPEFAVVVSEFAVVVSEFAVVVPGFAVVVVTGDSVAVVHIGLKSREKYIFITKESGKTYNT